MEKKYLNPERLQYQILKMTAGIFSLVPPFFSERLSDTMGRIWLTIDKRHANIALENIANAYGKTLSKDELYLLRKKHFVQFARLAFDIPRVQRLKKSNINDFISVDGLANLKSAFKQGRGVMLITAHMGNWELMAVSVPLLIGMPLNVIARPLDYRPLGRLATEIRERTGNRVLDKFDAGGTMRKLLAAKGNVGILLDQKASGGQAVDVPFFGRPALTNKVAALLALRYDPVVVPVFNWRMDDGRYKVVFVKPVRLTRSGDASVDIIENTARFNKIMEKYVRMAPANWFWTHRRWRH